MRVLASALGGLAVRLALALSGLGSDLQSRWDLASPLTGAAFAREALFQAELGGATAAAAAHSPFLRLPLLPWALLTRGDPLRGALAGAAADAVSCLLLAALVAAAARMGGGGGSGAAPTATAAGVLLWWSPFAALASAAGAASPLYTLALLAAACAAARGRALIAGAALAAAALMSAQALPFGLPLLLLMLHGPEEVHVSGEAGRREAGSAGQESGGGEHGAASSNPRWAAAALFVASFACSAAALLAGTAALLGRLYPAKGCSPGWSAWLDCEGGGGSGRGEHPLAWAGGARPPAPLPQVAWVALTHSSGLQGLTPNLGLQWYLFAEMFTKFRPFYRQLLAALPAASGAAIALRWPRRPLLLLACQALVSCLLGPHPTYADVALWVGLLPLLRPQLLLLPQGALLAAGLPVVLALSAAAHHLWIPLGLGNANFFYAMNLAWGLWQVVALLSTLRATAQLDRRRAAAGRAKQE